MCVKLEFREEKTSTANAVPPVQHFSLREKPTYGRPINLSVQLSTFPFGKSQPFTKAVRIYLCGAMQKRHCVPSDILPIQQASSIAEQYDQPKNPQSSLTGLTAPLKGSLDGGRAEASLFCRLIIQKIHKFC